MNNNKDILCPEEIRLLLENGNEYAFEAIFKLYYSRILHIANNYLGNKENSEEIAQNVFFKLWQEIESIQSIRNIGGYLFTMTRNACIDYLKHEKIKLGYAQSMKANIDLQYINDDTSALLLQNELMDKIEEGINLLPEKCKKIFIHSRFEGLKNQEIANLYALSKRTVDNHIAKGIKHMRLHLKDFTTLILFYWFL